MFGIMRGNPTTGEGTTMPATAPRLMPVVATIPLAAVALVAAVTAIRAWALPALGDDVADYLLVTAGLALSPAVYFVIRSLRARRRNLHRRPNRATLFVEEQLPVALATVRRPTRRSRRP